MRFTASKPHRRNAWLVTLSVVVSLCVCCQIKVNTRSLFAKVSYPDQSPSPLPPTPEALDLQVFANLELEAVMAYRNPAKMAMCLRALGGRKGPADKLPIEELGEKVTKPPKKWEQHAAEMTMPPECLATEEPLELIRYVVGRIANSVDYMAKSVAMTQGNQHEFVYKHVPAALNAIAAILTNTHPTTNKAAQDAPALALRGGAANGAFSAGFLFELLSLRERALPRDDDGQKYLFSTMVGTSVGALIAQILDLYFVDPKIKVTSKPQSDFVDECRRYWDPKNRKHTCLAAVDTQRSDSKLSFDGWPTNVPGVDDDTALSGLDAKKRDELFARHPRQMAALTLLYRDFTDDDEQTLMCLEPGPITRIAGWLGAPDQNLMRFDPMGTNVFTPVLDAFSQDMIQNDVTRVVVAVELESSQVVGLDERTCALMPSMPAQLPNKQGAGNQEGATGREYCLGSALMASVVMPAYARPVRHVYDGVVAKGLCGTWFDGGVRSVFPAYRALRMTRPAVPGIVENPKRQLRVLAVGTGTLEGLPELRPSNILDVTIDSEGQATGQSDIDEIMMARQMGLIRQQQICNMKKMDPSRSTTSCDDPTDDNEDVSVSSVYVPAETPAYIVAGAEYSFDRTLMRGLWIWGRHMAIARVLGDGAPKLFKQLGWEALQAQAIEYASADAVAMQPWLDAFSLQTESLTHRNARMQAGKNRITQCVSDCKPITQADPTIPQYFVCPYKSDAP